MYNKRNNELSNRSNSINNCIEFNTQLNKKKTNLNKYRIRIFCIRNVFNLIYSETNRFQYNRQKISFRARLEPGYEAKQPKHITLLIFCFSIEIIKYIDICNGFFLFI